MGTLKVQNTPELSSTGYIRQAQLIPDIIPISSATLWRLVKAGKFPQPIKLTERCTAWNVDDVRQWMNSKNTAGEF